MNTTPETPPPVPAALLTIPQAAKLLGVAQAYVYRRIQDGELPAVQMGTATQSKLRIRPDKLQEFIDARTIGTDPQEPTT